LQVATQLIAGFTSRVKLGAQKVHITQMKFSMAAAHECEFDNARSRICMECKISNKKTAKGRTPETKYKCRQCNVHLHR
jgi:hypothetical protein